MSEFEASRGAEGLFQCPGSSESFIQRLFKDAVCILGAPEVPTILCAQCLAGLLKKGKLSMIQ